MFRFPPGVPVVVPGDIGARQPPTQYSRRPRSPCVVQNPDGGIWIIMPEQSESTFQDLERLVIGTNKKYPREGNRLRAPSCFRRISLPDRRYCEKNDDGHIVVDDGERFECEEEILHKFCTENATVGSVSCQRHMAYVINNEPAVDPNRIGHGRARIKQPPITSNPISSRDRSTDR